MVMEQSRSMAILSSHLQQRLNQLDAMQRRRFLQTLKPGSGLDLTHNDYMGLRADAEFQTQAHKAAGRWPAGSGASRLLGGEHEIYAQLEAGFAAWKGAESALFFPSGYAANEALMSALQQGDCVFFSDELNHASLIDGLRLARLAPEQKQIFPHNDVVSLEQMLVRCQAELKIIVTETLFSMDGDFCPARELIDLCKAHGAILVVDEAHSLGVYGSDGAGWMAAQGIDASQYISVNPCGKAMAGSGALICGPSLLRDYLINTARSFIFTTGPSPWMAAALIESTRVLKERDERRHNFHTLVHRIWQGLVALGFNCRHSQSHIIPVILGSEARTLAAEAFCKDHGILVRAIRPPTVPEQSCRLRLSLHAGLNEADGDLLLGVFKELQHALSSDFHHGHRH